MEEEIQKKVQVRPPMDEVTRSERTFVDPIRSKLPDRYFRSILAPSQSSYGSHIKSKCFNCQGFGHHARDCPSPKINMPMKYVAIIENKETKKANETEETKLYHQVVEPLESRGVQNYVQLTEPNRPKANLIKPDHSTSE